MLKKDKAYAVYSARRALWFVLVHRAACDLEAKIFPRIMAKEPAHTCMARLSQLER